MADIKLFDVIERAFEKNAINKAKPKSEKLKGLENIYSPKMQEVVPKYGDAAAMAIPLFISTEAQPYAESRRKIEKYLGEGKSDRVINELNDITRMNKELMSQEPTTAIQNKLISNTEREVQLPRDTIEDIEMDLQNNPHLSEKEMEQIKKNALERFAKDQKPLNNLEATRPDEGTFGHSLDTADIFGKLMKRKYPDMSKEELAKKVEAAKLHDYGKGMVRNRDLISKVNFRKQPEISNAKRTEVNTHSDKGAEALRKIGEEQAARYSHDHHKTPETFENELLMISDIYNARTGKRVYKNPENPLDVLKSFQEQINSGKAPFSQEAYNLLKEAVLEGINKESFPQKEITWEDFMKDLNDGKYPLAEQDDIIKHMDDKGVKIVANDGAVILYKESPDGIQVFHVENKQGGGKGAGMTLLRNLIQGTDKEVTLTAQANDFVDFDKLKGKYEKLGFRKNGEPYDWGGQPYKLEKGSRSDTSISSPKNHQSDLHDVYATKAGNAIEQKGIKLFDVDAAKNNAAYRYSDLVQRGVGSIMAGKALQDLSKYTFGKADTRAKKKLLLEYFKDKDKVMYDRLRNGYYTNNKSIDKIFEDNIDGIIEMRKN